MNILKNILLGLAAGVLLTVPALAEDKNTGKADTKKSKYALTTCVVSDEKLGDMGEPYVFKHEGKEVQLCCKSCKKDFDKDPKKFMKKLEKAEKKADKKSS